MQWGWILGLIAILGAAMAPSAQARDPGIADWIRSTARPCDTCEPAADHEDLASLRAMVGDARVVALGEGTLGTREFIQLKHRMVDYLASEMGFDLIALPTNLPETRALDDYVRTGKGDPRALLSWYWLKYWPLDTEEMLAFVEWLRAYNVSHPERPLGLVGYDMSKPDLPTETARDFLRRVDPAWADSLESLASLLSQARRSVPHGVSIQAELPPAVVAGHFMRISGWIRTENVSNYAGLWCRADSGSATVAFANMETLGVKGTLAWKRYGIELAVPARANHIVFGALMGERGTAWFDSLGVEIDGRPWDPAGMIDLEMDSAEGPNGFRRTPVPGFEIGMDDSTAVVGRRSLRLSRVEGYVAPDPTRLWADVERRAVRLVERFRSLDSEYRHASSDEETAWATRNAELLLQRARAALRDVAADSCRAANVAWALERLPAGSKVVVWGHNDAVSRAPGALGDWLAKRFGREMVVVGFATNEGECTTAITSAASLRSTEIQPGPNGSFEALARATGLPRFVLDLRLARPGSAIATRLGSGLTLRSIGTQLPEQQFRPVALSREFDVIAWVERTQATRMLPSN